MKAHRKSHFIFCYFFSCLCFHTYTQTIGIGVQIGGVLPLNKVEYLTQTSPFVSYPNIPSISKEISLSLGLNNRNQLLIYVASYGQQVSAKFKENGHVIQSTHGSSNLDFGVKYYFRIKQLNTQVSKWHNYYYFGVNFENNVNRYVSFPSGSDVVYLYNFKRNIGIYPQFQSGYSIGKKIKRSSICFDLFLNFGFKYNVQYHFSSEFNNELHKAIVKRKGDFLSLAVRYNYGLCSKKAPN